MRKSLQPIDLQAAASRLRRPTLQESTPSQAVAAGIAITFYAAWNARNLMGAWLHSPFDRCDSLAFALWIVPIALLWVPRHGIRHPRHISTAAFATGLALSFSGIATDLGALKYLGFAVALAGFLPLQPATVLWLGCAVAWMPAAGWAFSSHGVMAVNATRIAIGLAAGLLTPSFVRHGSLT